MLRIILIHSGMEQAPQLTNFSYTFRRCSVNDSRMRSSVDNLDKAERVWLMLYVQRAANPEGMGISIQSRMIK